MWVRFWSKGNCPSGNNSEDSRYFWHDKDPGDADLKDHADDLVPGWRKGSERGYEYGFERMSKLPDGVRTSLLEDFRNRKTHAEKMIELLELTEIMEA